MTTKRHTIYVTEEPPTGETVTDAHGSEWRRYKTRWYSVDEIGCSWYWDQLQEIRGPLSQDVQVRAPSDTRELVRILGLAVAGGMASLMVILSAIDEYTIGTVLGFIILVAVAVTMFAEPE
jgi:hypothetical protein